jgi:hypothetical protein
VPAHDASRRFLCFSGSVVMVLKSGFWKWLRFFTNMLAVAPLALLFLLPYYTSCPHTFFQ